MTELTPTPTIDETKQAAQEALVKLQQSADMLKEQLTLATLGKFTNMALREAVGHAIRQGNHTVRTEKWRYIRYADGTEELYDMVRDPNEWFDSTQATIFAPDRPSLNAPPRMARRASIK